MSRFKDIPLPFGTIGFGFASGPRFSTTIVSVSSGAESANQNWANPLRRFTCPEAVRDQATFEAVRTHWLAMRGPFYTFPLRDALDFASVALPAANVAPDVSSIDQPLGIGDGFTRRFQLRKEYTATGAESETYSRPIYLPQVETVIVSMDGGEASPADYTVEREGGMVEFGTAPDPGVVLRWGGLFDVNVRFEADDSFDGIVRTYRVAGFADMTLLEIPLC